MIGSTPPPGAASPPGSGAGGRAPRGGAIRVAPALVEAAHAPADGALRALGSRATGLTTAEAAAQLARAGPNVLAAEERLSWPARLWHATRNPLVGLLSILAVVALATGDRRSASVIVSMVVIGVVLRFVQEARADAAAARLKSMIRVTATAMRDGAPTEVPLRDLVPGDVIVLAAGDMIPADVRVLSARDLFLNQASLTGESMPVEKTPAAPPAGSVPASPLELADVCWLGTSVQSGTGSALVVVTGTGTYFGGMARAITEAENVTAFDRGVDGFAWLMIRLTMLLVPIVFVVNGLTKHDWREAFLFALAVAVGLTPEMLPMIVSVCLAKGAVAMSGKKVIVKRLSAIQNFGAMDILCTDKTGTLTLDRVILERHCDVTGAESTRVLHDAFLISHFQTGLRNVLDQAILDHAHDPEPVNVDGCRKIDEVPFDFARRIMSVIVEQPDGTQRLLAKGAPEEIFRRCTAFELRGETLPVEAAMLDALQEEYESLSADGFRVLAVAGKTLGSGTPAPGASAPASGPGASGLHYATHDEAGLTLSGYVAFLDPPKDSAGPALAALARDGVTVKILTGDNDLVTRKVCSHLALPTARIVTGAEVEAMDDAALGAAVETVDVFARVSPAHKQRIILALRARDHVVGFLGDGINDAPALRAADVGISVDTAVDVAKESADIILLEKNLLVLQEGVLEGRKVFANVLKFIRMGASSAFGNMFSVLGASALLPFLPMAPLQILTNNLLYDLSQVPIPTDAVDAEQIRRPRPWRIGEIQRFILLVGPLSSVFDYTTFALMWFVFGATSPAHAALFQTGWFVESLMSQTLIIHVIRTNRIPFLQSRASWPLTVTTVLVMAAGAWLPYSPFAGALGLTGLPGRYWPFLAATLLAYLVLAQTARTWMSRRGWI